MISMLSKSKTAPGTRAYLASFVVALVVALLAVCAQPAQGKSADFPMNPDGSTYHVGTKHGEVANRIVIVGDLARAQTYADLYFDKTTPVFRLQSSRGFLTLTGRYRGTPVSVVGTGMGFPMVDFSIREIRAVLDGDVAMIRVGTCGTPQPPSAVALGDIAVSNAAVAIRRNPDAFRNNSEAKLLDPYIISNPVGADVALTEMLKTTVAGEVGTQSMKVGWDATADSFYSSQGRHPHGFDDRNEGLFDALEKRYDNRIISLEMETFHMFDLASVHQDKDWSFHAANALIVIAQRQSDDFIDDQLKHVREQQVGRAALDALVGFPLKYVQNDGVWNNKTRARQTL